MGMFGTYTVVPKRRHVPISVRNHQRIQGKGEVDKGLGGGLFKEDSENVVSPLG